MSGEKKCSGGRKLGMKMPMKEEKCLVVRETVPWGEKVL